MTATPPLSRREFLGGVAVLPFALLTPPTVPGPRVVVAGAGAFGGWTALQLMSHGTSVTLVDAWGAGNVRSSSGGDSRVIRAIYGADRLYVEMVRRAYELWLKLDKSLYTETGALWMHRGDDGYVRSAAPILRELGFAVDRIAVDEAARRWPQIDFRGIRSVWLEPRAGALAARRACMAVRDQYLKIGGAHRIAHAAPGPIVNERMTSVQLGDGTRLEADHFVFACGPWLGKLFADVIGDRIRPTRQEVHYFGAPAGSDRFTAGKLPIWIDFGERIVYGIPDLDGRGFKIADDTRGELFDPTSGDRTPTAAALDRARALLAERFPAMAKAPLLSAEVCQYENSPDGHLIVDRHPGAKNVWLVGGGSGHGFKLGPAVGEMVARRLVGGPELPALFRLDRLRDTKTQFQS